MQATGTDRLAGLVAEVLDQVTPGKCGTGTPAGLLTQISTLDSSLA